MGNLLCCVCKERKSSDDAAYGYRRRRQSPLATDVVSDGTERRRSSSTFGWHGTRGSQAAPASSYVEHLILETLAIIRTLVDNLENAAPGKTPSHPVAGVSMPTKTQPGASTPESLLVPTTLPR